MKPPTSYRSPHPPLYSMSSPIQDPSSIEQPEPSTSSNPFKKRNRTRPTPRTKVTEPEPEPVGEADGTAADQRKEGEEAAGGEEE